MELTPPSPTNSSLRTLHGMSGLFDTGHADGTLLKVSSAQSSELSLATTTGELEDLDSADLLQVLDRASSTGLPDEVSFLQQGNCSEVDLQGSISAIKSEFDQSLTEQDLDDVFTSAPGGTNEDSLLADLANIDFLESMTDISAFPLDGNSGMMFDPDELMQQTDSLVEMEPTEFVAQSIKRSASEAFEEEEEVTAAPVVVNPDHNDYTMKAEKVVKRARTATASTSSAVSCASTSSAMTKDEKYLERRRKNNIASRRSRETRKQKFCNMNTQADQLEADNARLRSRVEELEKLTKLMKDTLVQKLAGCSMAAATEASS